LAGEGFAAGEDRGMPLNKRKDKRFIRRLESDFFFGERKFKGISSDLSEKGLFVRTRNCLTVGSYINVVIYLPDGRQASVSGTVRRAVRTNSALVKNGMGIELEAIDINYADLMKEVTGKDISSSPLIRPASEIGPGDPTAGASPVAESGSVKGEFRVIPCPSCGIRNKIPSAKFSMGPRCDRCGKEIV